MDTEITVKTSHKQAVCILKVRNLIIKVDFMKTYEEEFKREIS